MNKELRDEMIKELIILEHRSKTFDGELLAAYSLDEATIAAQNYRSDVSCSVGAMLNILPSSKRKRVKLLRGIMGIVPGMIKGFKSEWNK